MQSPKYTFRDGIEPPYFQIFPSDENSEIIHTSCATGIWDREFPVYADELHEMKCAEDILCGKCEELILLATPMSDERINRQRRPHSRLD